MFTTIVRRYCAPAASAAEEQIASLLRAQLTPTACRVVDISGGCGAMYQIHVESPKFAGKSLVQQHRLVNEILKEHIKEMHGLRISTKASPVSTSSS
jgi:stress-induced morphogen